MCLYSKGNLNKNIYYSTFSIFDAKLKKLTLFYVNIQNKNSFVEVHNNLSHLIIDDYGSVHTDKKKCFKKLNPTLKVTNIND